MTDRKRDAALNRQSWCATCFRPGGDPDNPLIAIETTGFAVHLDATRVLCRRCALQRGEIDR